MPLCPRSYRSARAEWRPSTTGTTVAMFVVRLSHSFHKPVGVYYATADVTAKEGVDYVGVDFDSSNVLVFPASDPSKPSRPEEQSLTITINPETAGGSAKQFIVNLRARPLR